MRSVGIDIGRYSIKVVEISSNNRTYEITRAQEYSTLNLQTTDQEIEILQALKEISRDFQTDSARVSCSVRQQYVSSRKLFFPFRERVKIQKSLAFELEDELPLSVEKAIYDSKILAFQEKNAEVLAMACVSDEVEATLQLMQSGGIDPDIISPEISCLANLYENWQLNVDSFQPLANYLGTSMVVHLGQSKTFIGILSKGRLIWGRSVLWGVEKIAEGISRSFQVPYATALEMMPSKAFLLQNREGATKDQLKMADTVAEALDPLVQACRLTQIMVQSQFELSVDSIELLGPASNLKNLDAHLGLLLERPTQVGQPQLHLPQFRIQTYLDLDERYQMAIGLAIEGIKRPLNPAINFRQLQYAKKNQSLQKLWEKWGYGIQLAAAAYAFFFIYAFALDLISTHLEEVSNDVLIEQAGKIANLKGGSANQSKIRAYIRENNNRAKLVQIYQELDQMSSPIKVMSDLSQALPHNKRDKSFEVRRLFIDNETVDLQGVAQDQKTVERLEKALKSIALAGKVTPANPMIPQEQNRVQFAFNFKVKRTN